MKTMLIVFCHPDDESFITGGTIPYAINNGYTVHLLCLTKGQLQWDKHGFESKEAYGEARVEELKDAATVLGIHHVHIADYEDGHMKTIEPGVLEEDLLTRMKTIEPDITITFEPRGITNHPDHMKTSLSTTFAYQKYASYFVKGQALGRRDPRKKFIPKLGGYTHKEPPKLYYACMPQKVAEFLLKNDVIPKESFGKPWQGTDDDKVTTVIDIREYTETKLLALSKHCTQMHDVERFVSIDQQPLMYDEYYILRMIGEEEIFMGKSDDIAREL